MGFRTDERGVSPLLGGVILAGFLVSALVLYQVNVVPRENEEAEFEHYLRIVGDLQGLRNAVVSVAETNSLEAVAVELGVRYPRRTFARNPPPPQGTLRTTRVGTGVVAVRGLNASALCGLGPPVVTRSIVYEPDYNYLSTADPVVYENTVLYRPVDGGTIFESRQAIVRGETVNLPPIVGDLSRSSAREETVDFQGEITGTRTVSGPLTITLPTRLSADTWEDELLAGEPNVAGVAPNGSDAVDISLEPGTYTVRCTAVGAGVNPDAREPPTPTPSAGDGEEREINPAVPGSVRVENESRGSGGNSHVVTLVLNNTGDVDVGIQSARINFYQTPKTGSKVPTNADLADAGGTVSANLVFREDFTDVSPRITLPGNDTETDVRLEFYANKAGTDPASLSAEDWFVITFHYSNGEDGTYFVPVPK